MLNIVCEYSIPEPRYIGDTILILYSSRELVQLILAVGKHSKKTKLCLNNLKKNVCKQKPNSNQKSQSITIKKDDIENFTLNTIADIKWCLYNRHQEEAGYGNSGLNSIESSLHDTNKQIRVREHASFLWHRMDVNHGPQLLKNKTGLLN